MSDEMTHELNAERYRPLGFVTNPFIVREERSGAPTATLLEMQAESNRLLAHLFAAVDSGRASVVWVSKSDSIAGYFHMFAESDAERRMIVDDTLGMLPCYVQLYMARVGRVRSALNVLAERLATRSFEDTLAELLRAIADEPDTTLPEWKALDGAAWSGFLEALDSDALGAVREYFGEYELQRVVALEPPPSDIREISLEAEPEETEETAETDAMTESVPSTAPKRGEGPEGAVDAHGQVRLFLIAHVRAHYSPVIARGLRAYADEGFGQLMQELKITQAPRKTFKALMRLASLRFSKVVFFYDGLENWRSVPEELQIKFIAALSEIRAMAGRNGAMVFLAEKDSAPELEDQFGIGQRLEWTFPHLTRVNERPAAFDPEAVQWWLDSATVAGRTPHGLEEDGWPIIVEAAEGDMDRFCSLAATAVDRAAEAGVARVDEAIASEVVASMSTGT